MNIEEFFDIPVYKGQREHLITAVRRRGLGHACEFGVMRGGTLTAIANSVEHVYGFDTFTGLPEIWDKNVEGIATHTSRDHAVPNWKEIKWPKNSTLYPGLFKDTIPQWLNDVSGPCGFIHVDCDIYSSTRDVLFLLNGRIVPGTVIVFDELYPFGSKYPRWEHHEWKALCEWVGECQRQVKAISRSHTEQAAIEVVQ